jgi:hypothetical protein
VCRFVCQHTTYTTVNAHTSLLPNSRTLPPMVYMPQHCQATTQASTPSVRCLSTAMVYNAVHSTAQAFASRRCTHTRVMFRQGQATRAGLGHCRVCKVTISHTASKPHHTYHTMHTAHTYVRCALSCAPQSKAHTTTTMVQAKQDTTCVGSYTQHVLHQQEEQLCGRTFQGHCSAGNCPTLLHTQSDDAKASMPQPISMQTPQACYHTHTHTHTHTRQTLCTL